MTSHTRNPSGYERTRAGSGCSKHAETFEPSSCERGAPTHVPCSYASRKTRQLLSARKGAAPPHDTRCQACLKCDGQQSSTMSTPDRPSRKHRKNKQTAWKHALTSDIVKRVLCCATVCSYCAIVARWYSPTSKNSQITLGVELGRY